MFPKLELLNLKKNNIQTIIQVHHDKIEELYLNDNKIRKLNEKEWKVPKLKILNL